MINKDGRVYQVKENKCSWTLSRKAGAIEVTYNIPKESCATYEELEAFVAAEPML